MRQRKMKQYPKELKESIIARMLPPNNVSVPELVRDTGISKDTLYSWRTKARKGKTSVESNIHGELSSEEKFNIVLETASLNETEISEYCRRKGLFPQQITIWQEHCRQAHAPQTSKADRITIRAQKNSIKCLKTDLRRKEKALAEAAALLILQKKVHDLWEDPEDAKSTKLSVVK
jgi:transposase-like protein